MKSFTFLLLIACVSTHGNGFSQQVSLSQQNVGLEKVFKEIHKQTGYTFVYTRSLLKKSRDISIHVENASIERSLDICFKDQPLTYTILNRMVIIKEKEKTAPGRPAYVAPSAALPVKGKVTDNNGNPLEGATILVKGTNNGVKSDANGNFSINAELNSILIISFIGFENVEMRVTSNSSNLTISMEPAILSGSDIVVVGYSTKQLSQLSSSVTSISGRQLNDVTSNNPLGLLQGKAPGVIVSNSSGDPTTSSSIVIRGSGSITASASPLIVVDGMVGGNANPNDIESVTILKDAAATGLYGSRAANGVVIITTKSGKSGKSVISLSSTVGFNKPTGGNFHVMNTPQLYAYEKSFYPSDRFDAEIPSTVLSQNTNWVKEAFHTGMTQNYVLSASGGGQSTKFYIAGNYYSEDGTLRPNSTERYNVRANISHDLSSKLNLTFNVNARRNINKVDPSGLNGALYGAYLNIPWDNPYNADGTIRRGTEGGWFGREQENFLHGWLYNLNDAVTSGFDGDLNLRYKIVKNLVLSSFNRVGYASVRGEVNYDVRSKAGQGLGKLTNSFSDNLSLISSNRLNYDINFGDHQINALAVAEFEKNKLQTNSVLGEGFAQGLHVMNAASKILKADGDIGENYFNKGLAQIDYNFDRRYYLVGAYIRESSSRFGASNRAGNFYTLGASWLLSNEDFMQKYKNINLLKLRVSYGVTGNAQIGNYQSLGLYTFATQYAGSSGSYPSQIENQNLTWEKAKSTNIGIDLGFYKRITLNLDVYDKTTDGLLLDVEIPYTSGFSSTTRNIGSVRNRGLEINLNTINIDGAFKWETGFNIAFNKSKVLKLNEGKDIMQGNIVIREKQELYTWYMRKWAGVDPQNGDPLWEVVTTGNNGEKLVSTTNSYSDATLQPLGSASPGFTGGMSNYLSYGQFSLSFFFNFVSGNKVYHGSRELFDSDGAYYTFNSMVLKDDWNRWGSAGDIATHPKPVFGGNKNSNKTSSRFLEDGSYLRLRNITLAYELPLQTLTSIKLNALRFYVSADNLLTFTKFSGMDPEVVLGSGGGVSSLKYPISKKILFGINVNF